MSIPVYGVSVLPVPVALGVGDSVAVSFAIGACDGDGTGMEGVSVASASLSTDDCSAIPFSIKGRLPQINMFLKYVPMSRITTCPALDEASTTILLPKYIAV